MKRPNEFSAPRKEQQTNPNADVIQSGQGSSQANQSWPVILVVLPYSHEGYMSERAMESSSLFSESC